MNEQQGIEGFAAALADPAVGVLDGGESGESGPGSYDPIVAELRAMTDDPALLQPLQSAWANRRFTSGVTRPLLLLAALRARALAMGGAHPLATELLMDAVAPDLGPRLREALADPELITLLRERELRFTDPGRALLWGLPSLVLGFGHRGFDIIERNATAALGLVIDRTAVPFKFGTQLVQGFDFPAPERRIAFDPAPIPLTGEGADADVRWLTACIWPSESDRLARLKATLTHRQNPWRGDSPAPALIAADTARWDTLLASLPAMSRPTVLIDATAPYEASPEIETEGPQTWLRADPSALWTYLVRTGRHGARALRIEAVVWRKDAWQRIVLGEVGYHGASVTLDLSGPARLRALWQQPG